MFSTTTHIYHRLTLSYRRRRKLLLKMKGEVFTVSDYIVRDANLIQKNSDVPPPNGTSSKAPAIQIFGFSPALIESVIHHFSQLGEIVDYSAAPDGGNWVTVTYREAWCAARAVRRNGEIIGGRLMIGVKWVDGEPPLMHTPSASPAIGAEPEPLPESTTANTTGMSRAGTTSVITASPIGVMPSGSAFKKAAPRHKKSFSLFAADGTPHARLFAGDTDKALQQAKPPNQPTSSWAGRFSELVFGS
jgi:hypothetical protein